MDNEMTAKDYQTALKATCRMLGHVYAKSRYRKDQPTLIEDCCERCGQWVDSIPDQNDLDMFGDPKERTKR